MVGLHNIHSFTASFTGNFFNLKSSQNVNFYCLNGVVCLCCVVMYVGTMLNYFFGCVQQSAAIWLYCVICMMLNCFFGCVQQSAAIWMYCVICMMLNCFFGLHVYLPQNNPSPMLLPTLCLWSQGCYTYNGQAIAAELPYVAFVFVPWSISIWHSAQESS